MEEMHTQLRAVYLKTAEHLKMSGTGGSTRLLEKERLRIWNGFISFRTESNLVNNINKFWVS
jgi:hypothetical protein